SIGDIPPERIRPITRRCGTESLAFVSNALTFWLASSLSTIRSVADWTAKSWADSLVEGRNSEIGTYDPCANLASARVRSASRWSSRAIAGLHRGGRHDLSSTQRSACSVWDRRHTAVLSHFIRQEKLHSFSIARREARTLHSASIISGRPGR